MSTSPVLFSSYTFPSLDQVRGKWVPVACSLIFVCFTSTTFMGSAHTQMAVDAVWRAFFGHWHSSVTESVNYAGRWLGHFFGYGTIGLLFGRAWHASLRASALALRSRLALYSASLGVVSTFAVASLDEWHQHFLPGRTGCFHDVLFDTCGAAFLAVALWAVSAYRTRRLQEALEE